MPLVSSTVVVSFVAEVEVMLLSDATLVLLPLSEVVVGSTLLLTVVVTPAVEDVSPSEPNVVAPLSPVVVLPSGSAVVELSSETLVVRGPTVVDTDSSVGTDPFTGSLVEVVIGSWVVPVPVSEVLAVDDSVVVMLVPVPCSPVEVVPGSCVDPVPGSEVLVVSGSTVVTLVPVPCSPLEVETEA